MEPKHIDMQTPNGAQLNLDALYQIAPSCFTEAKGEDGKVHRVVDFNKLRLLLGDQTVEDAPEVYDFTWVGKRAALREAAAPINKTLRPCPEESVDWENTQNLYIEGDNLEVLKLLQNSYMGKVKMIYIDPPYNTGNDFVYHDDFAQSAEEYDESNRDEEGNRYRKNTDSNGRFHSDWCSMMYARLMVARNLLTDNGVIFISIGDEEVTNLKKISEEVFGSNNFIANLIWQSTPGSNTGDDVKTVTENILLFSKNRTSCSFLNKIITDHEKYSTRDEYFETRGGYVLNKLDRRMTGNHYSEALNYPIEMPDGSFLYPGNYSERQEHWNWRWSSSKVKWGIDKGFILMKKTNDSWSVYFKQYEKVDNEDKPIVRKLPYQNLLAIDGANSARGTREVMDIFDGKFFDYPKPLSLIRHLETMSLDKNDIILDFFSGSATTAQAAMQLNAEDEGNRKFILVQLPEETDKDSEAYKAGYKNICEIGKERIRRAGAKIKDELKSKADSLESTIDRMLHATPDNTVRMLPKEQQKEIAEKIYKEQIVPKQKELDAINRTIENLDIGFRVFKCEDSNYKDVAFAPKDYTQDMLAGLLDNIKEDRTDLDLLFDCLLRWGVELSLPLETTKVDGCTIHNVNDGDLVACFDGNVTEKVIDAIAALSPVRVVFRDNSFTEAANKMNLFELFKQKCNWDDEEVKNNVRVI